MPEQVAGDVAMCSVGITKRLKPEKLSKEEKRTKKRKTLKLHDVEVKKVRLKVEEEMAGGAVCGVGVTKRPPKPDEMEVETVVDAGSGSKEKQTLVDAGSGSVKRRKTKVVTWRLSQELVDYLWTREALGYLATETPRPTLIGVPEGLFGQELKEEIAAEFNENKEFDAYVLYQYRTKGYADIQEEVTDNEDDGF